MANYHIFRIKNTFTELELLCSEISEITENSNFSDQLVFALNVCLEEMLTNIIKYAYDDHAMHEIEVRLEITDQVITLTIIDDGHRFNPLETAAPDVSSDIINRPLGGIGIYLTCKMANKVSYTRKNDKNIFKILLTPHVVIL
ncbi:MAG: ATP-binding protein [Victivallaceae bacterium]|nr:ATP-binding protein [Victivallaceae bacterium]